MDCIDQLSSSCRHAETSVRENGNRNVTSPLKAQSTVAMSLSALASAMGGRHNEQT